MADQNQPTGQNMRRLNKEIANLAGLDPKRIQTSGDRQTFSRAACKLLCVPAPRDAQVRLRAETNRIHAGERPIAFGGFVDWHSLLRDQVSRGQRGLDAVRSDG